MINTIYIGVLKYIKIQVFLEIYYVGMGLRNNEWGVQSMIEQVHLEKNKGNTMEYNGMNKRNTKKTLQWEVVATQAYLKNMNALFITHG